jgi:anthranilate synthase component 1
MQIIDRLEANRRGPYGGGIGHVSFTGSMDMALGLRTMVIPTTRDDTIYRYNRDQTGKGATSSRKEWVVHIQVRNMLKSQHEIGMVVAWP